MVANHSPRILYALSSECKHPKFLSFISNKYLDFIITKYYLQRFFLVSPFIGNQLEMKQPTRLRTKIIAYVVVFILLIVVSLQITSILIIQPSFKSLEKHEASDGLAQAISALHYRLDELKSKVIAYSAWNETYDYVQSLDQEYVENFYIDKTFENLNINLVVIFNDDSLLYYKSYDFASSSEVQLSDEAKSMLRTDEILWTFGSEEETVSGILSLDNRPMMIVSAPILTDIYSGPIRGGLLFGRYVDEKVSDEISILTNAGFSLKTVLEFTFENQQNQVIGSLVDDKQLFVTEESNSTKLSAFTLVNDIHSNPVFILEIIQDRAAFNQGVWVGNVFLAAVLLLSAFFGSTILFVLRKRIIEPLTNLAAYFEGLSIDPNYPEPKLLANPSREIAILTIAVKETLKKKLEGMIEVSTMVGHDLRNPLSGIKNATYFLNNYYGEKLDDKAKAQLKNISDCVEYSDKIVRDLLDYSCEIKLDKIKITPKKLLDVTFSAIAVPNNIEVVNKVGDEFSLSVDGGYIQRVFTNLIRNAFDAMPEGGKLEITCNKIEEYLNISFSDNGLGMSEKVLKRLWTPFFTTKAKGMGVGLSICRKIIQAHGGNIGVTSTIGQGTTFTVSLPLDKS
jgi:signal transduction histidine kinase